MTPERSCSTCGAVNPACGFVPKRGQCVDCKRKSRAAWAKANPERAKAIVVRWRAANREHMAEWAKAYAENNRARKSAYNHDYYKLHGRHQSQEYDTAWREANRDKSRGYYRSYRERNPDKYRASAVTRRARLASSPGRYTASDLEHQFNTQNGACFYCAKPLRKFHIDHKTPISRGGSNLPNNIVCACAPCNLSKSNKTAEEFIAYMSARADVRH